MDSIREAPLGQIVRWLSGNRYFKYPEELDGFELPEAYTSLINRTSEKQESEDQIYEQSSPSSRNSILAANNDVDTDLEKKDTGSDHSHTTNHAAHLSLTHTKSHLGTAAFTNDRLDEENALALARTQTKPIAPQKTADGIILVDWYATDDSANPQNWSQSKRFLVSLIVCVYTFVVYAGSAIYTSSIPELEEKWDLRPVEASLPLSLYVLAYGIGPLLWAPLSEIPIIGRNPVYAGTMFMFTVISLPTALVDNFAGLLVLRFLQGFFGSPCLANGGATMQDMYPLLYLPYALTAWVSAAFCGPALGPLLSGFAVTAEGWRWSLWEILWAAGPIFLVMFLLLPETSTPNILLRRAQRLRKLTGNHNLQSQSEIDQKNIKPSTILIDAVIKPIEITIKDPAIAFVNVYTAIIYGIYYSYFEVFPLVFPVFYGFSIGMVGVVFTCILVACLIGVAIYCAYLHFLLIPSIKKNGLGSQESRLVPAIYASFGPTIGLFIFAWTARPDIHWIAPTIGITLYGSTVFVIMQCIFVYVPLSYPQYAASLFAGNDFLRSAFACGSILFGRPLFINLGIDKGVTVLAGLSVIGIIGMFVLYIVGAKLRARSKFAV